MREPGTYEDGRLSHNDDIHELDYQFVLMMLSAKEREEDANRNVPGFDKVGPEDRLDLELPHGSIFVCEESWRAWIEDKVEKAASLGLLLMRSPNDLYKERGNQISVELERCQDQPNVSSPGGCHHASHRQKLSNSKLVVALRCYERSGGERKRRVDREFDDWAKQ